MGGESFLNERSGLFFIEVGTYIAVAGYTLYKLNEWSNELGDWWDEKEAALAEDWSEFNEWADREAHQLQDWARNEEATLENWWNHLEDNASNAVDDAENAVVGWWHHLFGNDPPPPPTTEPARPVGTQAGSGPGIEGLHDPVYTTSGGSEHEGMVGAGDGAVQTASVQQSVESTTAQLQAAGLIPPNSSDTTTGQLHAGGTLPTGINPELPASFPNQPHSAHDRYDW